MLRLEISVRANRNVEQGLHDVIEFMWNELTLGTSNTHFTSLKMSNGYIEAEGLQKIDK